MGFFDKYRRRKIEERLKKNLYAVLETPISNIMSKYVISIQTHDTLQHAAQVIVGEKVSCVVVKDGDRPIGIITERDFLNKAPVKRKELESNAANSIMSPKLVTINPEKTVSEAVDLLIKYNFRKLVVEDSDGRMIGIVTQTDFVRVFDKFYNDLNVKTPDLVSVADVMTKKVIQ